MRKKNRVNEGQNYKSGESRDPMPTDLGNIIEEGESTNAEITDTKTNKAAQQART